MTDDSAVLDEVDVGLEHLVGLEHPEEQLVGVVGGGLRSDQADPPGDALHVPIDRHQRQTE